MAHTTAEVLMPLHAFRQGDTLGIVVLVSRHDTVARLADQIQRAAAVRVRPTAAVAVTWRGRRLDPAATVGSLGLAALDRIDLSDVLERP